MELLVVIGIIALLISILLPALDGGMPIKTIRSTSMKGAAIHLLPIIAPSPGFFSLFLAVREDFRNSA